MKLVIVESPNKVKTISSFLSNDFTVKACVGHICRINDKGPYNLGIDIDNNFKPDFVVDDGKKDIVKELKELVKKADEVILASDPDREGEAIAYHLKEQLKIPNKKLKRCTFQEITKKAVLDAINNPRSIDNDLVDAAIGRSILDKIIGYRLSPLARRSVKAKSVGRCQSAALKLVVDREREIKDFVSKDYYELWLEFEKNKSIYKAQYKGLATGKTITTYEDKDTIINVMNECSKGKYLVYNIEQTDRKVQSKPPFTTSTYQQEVSSRLGYSVKKAQQIAQQLFEGINIGGQHKALITYIRTDSTELSEEFVASAKEYIEKNYSKKDYVGVKKSKKAKNAQEAHEAIRPVDLSMTPELLSRYINDSQLLKVYELIYNRTLASLMKEAVITDTNYIILNGKHKFVYTEHSLKDAGWKKVYNDEDDELCSTSIGLTKDEIVKCKKLDLQEKHTNPPRRYTEASLVKKLEEVGLGRPSTFSNIIGVLLDKTRNYCEESCKSIAPTELGMILVEYLEKAFPNTVDINYTSNMELSLDKIAHGELKVLEFLTDFYSDLEQQIKAASKIKQTTQSSYIEGRTCPNCGGRLVLRYGKYGKFIGCENYKKKSCTYTEKV